MAVSSGVYALTLEHQFKKTVGGDMESTNVSVMMVLDAEAPNFATHDMRDDLIQEVADGSGYTNGGKALAATPTWVVGAPAAADRISYDSGDPSWAASTITNAEAAVLFYSTGTDSSDNLFLMSDFGAPVSTANGTLTITVDTPANGGWYYVDFQP
jgi:hypothetical protein